jgi:hypothetical protein
LHISDCNLASSRTLARGVGDSGLYRLLANPMALLYFNEKLDQPSRLEEAHVEHVWQDAMEIGSKPIVESGIDSKLAIYGSVLEYSQAERVDIDDTLASRFSSKEGVDFIEDVASVARGFEVHGHDTHDYMLLILLARYVDLRDVGVWQATDNPELCSFKFTFGGMR